QGPITLPEDVPDPLSRNGNGAEHHLSDVTSPQPVPDAGARTTEESLAVRPSDPFAEVAARSGPMDSSAVGEQTRFFIAQSGVNKRNSPYKVVAWVGGGLGALAVVI